MRIWDVSPGYLNRQSLLGEHRELHGLLSILLHGRKGYSRHPETLRWVGCLSGLARRHEMLAAEMRLRGYSDRTPVETDGRAVRWPDLFVTPPAGQFLLLGSKYLARDAGRIALPRNAQDLWGQHKYSVMARDPERYRSLGRRVARMRRGSDLAPLAEELALLLRQAPANRTLVNAVEHMWGHVSKSATPEEKLAADRSTAGLFGITCAIAVRTREPYLLASTALGDLGAFVTSGRAPTRRRLRADPLRPR